MLDTLVWYFLSFLKSWHFFSDEDILSGSSKEKSCNFFMYQICNVISQWTYVVAEILQKYSRYYLEETIQLWKKEQGTCQNLSKAIFFLYVLFSITSKIFQIQQLDKKLWFNLFADNLTFHLEAKNDLYLEFRKVHLIIFQSFLPKKLPRIFLSGRRGWGRRREC